MASSMPSSVRWSRSREAAGGLLQQGGVVTCWRRVEVLLTDQEECTLYAAAARLGVSLNELLCEGATAYAKLCGFRADARAVHVRLAPYWTALPETHRATELVRTTIPDGDFRLMPIRLRVRGLCS